MGITTGKTNGQMENLIIGKQKISHSVNSRPMSVGEHHPAFKRFTSQMRSSLLPGAFASAPRCVRVWGQTRLRLLPRSLIDFGIGLSTRAAGGRMAGKTDVNNREMRCFQSCAVFFRLTRKSLSVGILSGKNQWRCGNTFRGNSGW